MSEAQHIETLEGLQKYISWFIKKYNIPSHLQEDLRQEGALAWVEWNGDFNHVNSRCVCYLKREARWSRFKLTEMID